MAPDRAAAPLMLRRFDRQLWERPRVLNNRSEQTRERVMPKRILPRALITGRGNSMKSLLISLTAGSLVLSTAAFAQTEQKSQSQTPAASQGTMNAPSNAQQNATPRRERGESRSSTTESARARDRDACREGRGERHLGVRERFEGWRHRHHRHWCYTRRHHHRFWCW